MFKKNFYLLIFLLVTNCGFKTINDPSLNTYTVGDIKIVGDRFIFETELLFDSASADLQESGKEKLSEIGLTLKETTVDIPSEIDWIIMVEGHTDKRPINTFKFPSNWELSTARANSVLKLLLDIGFAPDRLAAAGYGEFYPISDGDTDSDYQQNRRIELKLTSR